MNWNASILRMEGSPEGVVGVLKIREKVIAFTLEHPDHLIPPGIYGCVKYPSEQHGMTYLIQVPGRSGILFHVGNRIKDTTGCVLLGRKVGWIDGERAVLESRNSYYDFRRIMGSAENFTVHVIEVIL